MGLKDSFQFIDLFTFDPSSAAEFGIPVDQCKGMILLFPLSPNDKAEERAIDNSAGPKFIQQTIENSCCLMALLHLLLNNSHELLKNESDLPEIMKVLQSKSEGNELLIENSVELKEIHESIAKAGGTDVSSLEDDVPFHFVALIPFNNAIWLMDGRRSGPIEFKTFDGCFFDSACKISNEEFVQKSEDQTNFAAVILV